MTATATATALATMSPPSNQAAYLTSKSAYPLTVQPAPYTPPGPSEILIHNHALAINPADWFKQVVGNLMFTWIKYPAILGSDLAGTVVAVGPAVSRFQPGDRVLAHAVGTDPRSAKSAEGAFQLYAIARESLTAPIPDDLSFEDACVLPLGLSTAACGLFMKDFLALEMPRVEPVPTGKTLLVWGASTSVGCNAVQLAVAAGYEVIATSSAANFEYVKALGAAEVYSYKSPTAMRDIIAAFTKRECVGAIAIGNGSLRACIEIVASSKGRKFVAQTSVDLPDGPSSSLLGWMSVGFGMAGLTVRSKLKGVATKFIFGSDLIENEVGNAIYRDFLPAALAQRKFIPAPIPLVVGRGLEHVQEAMDLNRKGVSARKVVVTL